MHRPQKRFAGAAFVFPTAFLAALVVPGCEGDAPRSGAAEEAGPPIGSPGNFRVGVLELDGRPVNIHEVRRCTPPGSHPDDRELILLGEGLTAFLYDTHRGGGVRTVELTVQDASQGMFGGSVTRLPDGRWVDDRDTHRSAPPIEEEGDRVRVTLTLEDPVRTSPVSARIGVDIPSRMDDC